MRRSKHERGRRDHAFTASATDVLDGAIATCIAGQRIDVRVRADDGEPHGDRCARHHSTASFTVTVVDSAAPVVTAPAPLTVAATEVEGARGNIVTSPASASLRAFLAGDTAVDGADGHPIRQAPQVVIGGETLEATTDTVFPVGISIVTFSFRDAHGNLGSAASSVTVTPPVGAVADAANQPVIAKSSANAPQPVTVSFATVMQPGLLTADAVSEPTPAPAGYLFVGAVLDIVATAVFDAPIEVCFVGGGYTAADRVLHGEDGEWADVTTSVSPTRLCATVWSLSPFAVITPENHAPSAIAGASQEWMD